MATVATLLERNKTTSHTPLPYLSELAVSGKLPIHTLIITCLDPRCIPEKYFNFGIGEALVQRNAGGNVRHALRDILILDKLFDLEDIAIVHHTDCGTLQFTNEKMREGAKAGVDKAHWADIDKIEFGANTDIEESVKGDLEWVSANPLIREELKKTFQGFVFDIKTGIVTKVDTV